jgi:hypothetical protein
MASEDCTTSESVSAQESVLPTPPPAPSLNPRKATVGYIGDHRPYLRLQGRWLERAGFGVGTAVHIEVFEGRLVLSRAEPKPPVRCAEPHCPHEAKARSRSGPSRRRRNESEEGAVSFGSPEPRRWRT